MRINSDDIQAMPTRRRAAMINSLSGYKSANLVGTVDGSGATNLSMVSSVVHLGSNPPLMAMIIRPGGEERHTLANILETWHYTINHVDETMIERAHQTAARYARDISEFDAAGLTHEWWPSFSAPLVQEASIKLALELREHQKLDINGTHLVIGEIYAAEIPDDSVREDGTVMLHRGGTVALAGLDSYYRPALVKRMAYAKPDLPPRLIPADNPQSPPSPRALVNRLLDTQVQCVLSTVTGTVPKQHMMAYAFDSSLQTVYLASKRSTEKVENMLANSDVSLLWDNRTGNTADHSEGLAAMATARVSQSRGWMRARAEYLLLARNPELSGLLAGNDAVVFSLAVDHYRLVQGYDSVTLFTPGRGHLDPSPEHYTLDEKVAVFPTQRHQSKVS